MDRPTFKKTERGFAYSEFEDLYGAKCSLQKSSLATDDAVWLGIDDPDPKRGPPWKPYKLPSDVLVTTRMHLSREQVEAILPALQRFVATGELPEQEGEQVSEDKPTKPEECDHEWDAEISSMWSNEYV
ncbi:unnamed protein product, partial [marine sediment metagenome]